MFGKRGRLCLIYIPEKLPILQNQPDDEEFENRDSRRMMQFLFNQLAYLRACLLEFRSGPES